jgi:hypothetical protein
VLSKLAYLTLYRSIQALALLAHGDATKDLERRCCIAASQLGLYRSMHSETATRL